MGNRNDVKIALISLFTLDFGASHISSFLKENGYPTYIIFFNKQRYSIEFLGNDYFSPRLLNHQICNQKDLDLLISLLKELNPAIIGISLSSVTMQTAICITQGIKKHLDAIVVWGGIHAIIAPQECIKYADIVCVGEGEFPMLELAEKIRYNQVITGIRNLWIKKRDGIEKNEMRQLIENLDELPFPDLVDRDNKFLIDGGRRANIFHIISVYIRSVYPIMTSRGCMFSCAFCCNSVFRERYKGKGAYLRRRSVENVIAELKFAIRNRSIRAINFWDDVFTFDRDWIGRFCSQYIREIGKPFACYVHPKYTNRDIMLKLRQAGLSLITMGIQSGSEDVAKQLFSRIQSNQEMVDFSYFMKELGISMRYDLISDNPYETDEDQDISTGLLLQLPHPYQIQFYSLCWFPETPLTKRALADGIISPGELEQYTSKALNNFYMYIPLSRNKRDLFWNCIKAMAVNRYFPKAWVRFCKKSIFFRRYPKFLFFLARNYLRLFTRMMIEWEGKKIVVRKQFPFNATPSVVYYKATEMINAFVVGRADWLFLKPEIEYSFFLLESREKAKRFCLRMRQQLKRGNTFRILMGLAPFRVQGGDSFGELLWLMEFSTGHGDENDVYFDLSYPRLSYSIDGHQYKAKLLRERVPFSLNKGIYSLYLRYAAKPNVPIGEILFEV